MEGACAWEEWGGDSSFNLIFTVSAFDIAVSHLSLTGAERESGEEGATMGEAMRGTRGREEGGGLSGLNSRD